MSSRKRGKRREPARKLPEARQKIKQLKTSNLDTSYVDGIEVLTWSKTGKVASVTRIYRGKYPVEIHYRKLRKNKEKRTVARIGAYRYRLELFYYRNNPDSIFVGNGVNAVAIRCDDIPELIDSLVKAYQTVKGHAIRDRS